MSLHRELGSYRAVSPVKDDEVPPIAKEVIPPLNSIHESYKDANEVDQEPKRTTRDVTGDEYMTKLDRFNDWTNDIWLWELLAIFLSLTCLGIVIWRLVTIDQKPYAPYENTRPSPNTFISIFVTASKSFLLFAVADGIGQLRWLYYQSTPKSLDELDMFEGASRGAGGSLLFLLFTEFDKGKAKMVASWGALLMIVALAMDPFAQEILTFPSRHVPLPRSESAAWMSSFIAHGQNLSVVDGSLGRQAVFGGILGFDVPVAHGCSTGNCTWEPFTSLGICSRCTDSTKMVPTCADGSGVVNHNCTQLQYQFPENITLVLQNGSLSADDGSPLPTGGKRYTLLNSDVSQQAQPKGFQDPTQFSFALASFNINLEEGIDNSAQLANPSWTITNCSVGWCAKVFENLKVSNNVLTNNVARDVPVQPVANSSCWSSAAQDCQQFEPIPSGHAPAFGNSSFYVEVGQTSTEVRNLMEFNYNLTVEANTTRLFAGQQWDYSFASLLFVNRNITQVFEQISVAYTNFLRTTDNPIKITGTATNFESYVNVTWRWFILPAVVGLVAAAFLLTVIIYTKWEFGGKNVIWKTTTLPLLLHGLEGWDRDGYSQIESSAAMNARARTMRAMLKRDDTGQLGFVRS